MESNETELNGKVGGGTGTGGAKPAPRKRPIWAIAAATGIILIVIIIVAVLVCGSSPDGGRLTVSIDAPAQVDEGGDFVVRIKVEDVVKFDSANYDITYDPDVIEVAGVNNGSLNATNIPIANWMFDPPAFQGTVRIINNVPGFAGVNGSGYLAEVPFQVVGSSGDTSSIAFTGEGVIFDNTAEEIPARWVGGLVKVR